MTREWDDFLAHIERNSSNPREARGVWRLVDRKDAASKLATP
jgi:hypothetical protein